MHTRTHTRMLLKKREDCYHKGVNFDVNPKNHFDCDKKTKMLIQKKYGTKKYCTRARTHTGYRRTGVASVSGIETTCTIKLVSNITRIN